MLITRAKLITWTKPNQILEDHALLIQDGKIADIGLAEAMENKYSQEEKLDARGQVVMPGLICTHTHFYSAYSRGMALHGDAPANFPEILDKLWWPLDLSLSLEDVRVSAMMGIVDAIKHGTTTLVDHHASYGAVSGSLSEIARAVDETGLRASLCYEVSDRNGPELAQEAIEENRRFIEYVQREKPMDGRLAAMFGLHASLTLSPDTLSACKKAAPDGVGFHIHVAEDIVDEYDSINKYGLRVVDRLNENGILGPNTVVGHATHVDAREVALLAETGTWVSHQPRSNMNNAVGVSAVESMMRAGVKVVLGNDGFSNAMLDEWRTTYLVHKVWNRDPRRMGGYDLVDMAVYNNGALASAMFGQKVGVVEKGSAADLIFVDYLPYTPMTDGNLPWHILFGFRDSLVTTTIVAGKVLMKDRQLLTVDEEKLNAQAQKLVPETWQRFQAQFVS